MNYEITKKQILKATSGGLPGIIIEKMELIPRFYDVVVPMNPPGAIHSSFTPDIEAMKLTIAKSITEDIITNLGEEESPRGLKSYKLSSVVYYKPNEKELYDLLRTQYSLNDKLNIELYDYRVLSKSPWKLFKQFFKSFFN